MKTHKKVYIEKPTYGDWGGPWPRGPFLGSATGHHRAELTEQLTIRHIIIKEAILTCLWAYIWLN